MLYKQIYIILGMVYSTILRGLLKKAVDDPEEEWDEMLLDILDRLFGHKL